MVVGCASSSLKFFYLNVPEVYIFLFAFALVLYAFIHIPLWTFISYAVHLLVSSSGAFYKTAIHWSIGPCICIFLFEVFSWIFGLYGDIQSFFFILHFTYLLFSVLKTVSEVEIFLSCCIQGCTIKFHKYSLMASAFYLTATIWILAWDVSRSNQGNYLGVCKESCLQV